MRKVCYNIFRNLVSRGKKKIREYIKNSDFCKSF